MATKRIVRALLSAILLALAAPTNAAPITIFNTGVDNSGISKLDNTAELHYSLVTPSPIIPFVTTSAGGFPVGPWLATSTISAWIAPSASTNAAAGTYTYSTTFDLTGFDETTALLVGRWSTDNNGLNILINGIATGQTTGFSSFNLWTPFIVTTGFSSSLNTLNFVVNNGGTSSNPTGLRVEFLVATADLKSVSIPEPASLTLLGLASLGAALLRRRKNQN